MMSSSDFALEYTSTEEFPYVSATYSLILLLSARQTDRQTTLQIYETLRATFHSCITLPLAYRRHQLYQVARMVQQNRDSILTAISADLGRPEMETTTIEIGTVIEKSIKFAELLDE